MAFLEACVSTSGLTYDLTHFHLGFGHSESICNTFKEPEATIELHTGEALLIYPNPE